MSLKMMFANYQNSVEHKLSTMLHTTDNGVNKSGITVPNVMKVLDNDESTSKFEANTTQNSDNATTTPESHINSILNNLLPSDELVSNGPIPIFQIVSMTSNPMFTNASSNQEQNITSSITELDDDVDIENLDLEPDSIENINTLDVNNPPVPATESAADLDIGDATDIDFDMEEFSASNEDDIKTVSLDSKKKEIDMNTTSTASNDEGVKTINLVPDVSFKLNGNLDNTLEGIMDELEELSEIASVCDYVRTINVKTMTPADLANLSVRELKDLCTKNNIKNKKGTKTELIERLTTAMTS